MSALAVLLAPIVLALQAGWAPARDGALCRLGYAYAGQEYFVARHGVRATISMVAPPRVAAGHVGGWVGIRGPKLGPRGPAEWLQSGDASFDSGPSQLYYEDSRPTQPPLYHVVRSSLGARSHLISVLETSGRQGMWRVWVDNRAVSPPIEVTTSHARLVTQAIGETWNTSRRCNSYAYRFGGIQLAARRGGSWTAPTRPFTFGDARNRTAIVGPGAFIARSVAGVAASKPSEEPPLLGAIATTLSGRPLAASCTHGSDAVSKADRLFLPEATCETLVGYAVAEPWVPKANSLAGFKVALQGLVFLRGVARATQVPADRVDCRVVSTFYRAFRRLGATAGQALALRAQLLRRKALIVPRVSLAPGCHFH